MCLGPRWITHLCKTFNISRRCQYTEGVNSPTVQLIKCSKLHIVSKAISTVRDFNYKKIVLMISSNCYLSFIRSVPLVCISFGLERALPAGKVHSLYLQPKKEKQRNEDRDLRADCSFWRGTPWNCGLILLYTMHSRPPTRVSGLAPQSSWPACWMHLAW